MASLQQRPRGRQRGYVRGPQVAQAPTPLDFLDILKKYVQPKPGYRIVIDVRRLLILGHMIQTL